MGRCVSVDIWVFGRVGWGRLRLAAIDAAAVVVARAKPMVATVRVLAGQAYAQCQKRCEGTEKQNAGKGEGETQQVKQNEIIKRRDRPRSVSRGHPSKDIVPDHQRSSPQSYRPPSCYFAPITPSSPDVPLGVDCYVPPSTKSAQAGAPRLRSAVHRPRPSAPKTPQLHADTAWTERQHCGWCGAFRDPRIFEEICWGSREESRRLAAVRGAHVHTRAIRRWGVLAHIWGFLHDWIPWNWGKAVRQKRQQSLHRNKYKK